MSRSKEPYPKTNPESELTTMFLSLRNDEKQAINIVRYLEGDSYKQDVHNLEFCKAYVAKLIQLSCENEVDNNGDIVKTAEDKAEMMLASCGLLDDEGLGFEVKKQEARQRIYYERTKEYNTLLGPNLAPSSITAECRKALADITSQLSDNVDKKRLDNGGKLNFIEQVPDPPCLPSLRDGKGIKKESPERSGKQYLKHLTRQEKILITIACVLIIIAIELLVLILIEFKDAPPENVPPRDYEFNNFIAYDVVSNNSTSALFRTE